jgi:ElaB/YqjD/DUF883 family membrane-anchored ribosome-binding protein
MANVSENMSRLEQEARELVMKFKELNEQTGSYREAKGSLQETKQKIESLIETTKNLMDESKSVISKFNEISGVGFMKHVEEINKNNSQIKSILNQINQQLITNLEMTDNKFKKSQWMFLATGIGIAIIIGLQIIQILFSK